MSEYVKVSGDNVEAYPYSVAQLKKDNAGVSFPKAMSAELLESFGVYPVVVGDMPAANLTDDLVFGSTPVKEDDVWKIQVTKTQKSAPDAERVVRDQRNALLQETDWWAMSDLTMTSDQIEYRNLLRQVPQQDGFPFFVTWPTKP
jgi:hypothetical protein